MSPCGLACSLDRLASLKRGAEATVLAPLWTQRLICYNVSLIYLTTVWLKYGGNLWREGLATYYPNRLQEFERFPVPDFIKDLPMVRLTTYGTLLVEFSMVSLVYYRPLRKYVLSAAVLMHLFIEYSMNIPLFAFLMITSYINFFDGEEVTHWAKRVGERLARFRMNVPISPQTSEEKLRVLKAMDPFDLVAYRLSDEAPSTEQLRGSALRSVGSWYAAWIPGWWRKTLTYGENDAQVAI
jgi:hypothetical protein